MNAAEKVQELLKIPQHLCKMCGKCCKVATFKGGLSHQEIIDLINDPASDPYQVEGAKDFLTIFEPYKNLDEVRKVSSSIINRVLDKLNGNDKVAFFYCKFIGEAGKCLIHEDRPLLCRMYPIPHERTIYNENCGFEEEGIKKWNEIIQIIADLQKKLDNP